MRGHDESMPTLLGFGFDQFCLAAFIHAVDCKNILGKINSNSDNVHDFPLLVVLMKMTLSKKAAI